MAGIRELGYVGFEISDSAAWKRFATDILGFGIGYEDADGPVGLRLDGKIHRIVLEPGSTDDLAFVGFDCGDDATLDALVVDLGAAGIEVTAEENALARRRRVGRLVSTRDPAGNRVELYTGLADADNPFESELVPSGFHTRTGGAGHTFFPVADSSAMLDFYARLGFHVSDYISEEVAPGVKVDATFLHCNTRHHTVAFAAMPSPKKMHHFMVETNDRVDVGCAYDRVLEAGIPVELTLGMHPNDRMFSFYVKTPSGFAIEFGSDGREITDPAAWKTTTYDQLSIWGHNPPPAAAPAS